MRSSMLSAKTAPVGHRQMVGSSGHAAAPRVPTSVAIWKQRLSLGRTIWGAGTVFLEECVDFGRPSG